MGVVHPMQNVRRYCANSNPARRHQRFAETKRPATMGLSESLCMSGHSVSRRCLWLDGSGRSRVPGDRKQIQRQILFASLRPLRLCVKQFSTSALRHFQHVSTSARQHVSTSARQHVGTPARPHVGPQLKALLNHTTRRREKSIVRRKLRHGAAGVRREARRGPLASRRVLDRRSRLARAAIRTQAFNSVQGRARCVWHGNNHPVRPGLTSEVLPGIALAITGKAQAIASSTTFGMPS